MIYRDLKTASELSKHFFKDNRLIIPQAIRLPGNEKFKCFQCKKSFRSVHGIYIKCCKMWQFKFRGQITIIKI